MAVAAGAAGAVAAPLVRGRPEPRRVAGRRLAHGPGSPTRQRSAPIERQSPSGRPWSGRRRNHAARFPATNISQPALALFAPLNSTRDAIKAPQLSRWGAGRLGARPEIAAEVIGHQPDLFLRPQPAASDHAIDRGLPSAAILPLVAKHRIGVALEALAHYHAASGMLRALLSAVLPMGRSGEQQQRACERGTDTSPDDHCVSLQAFWSNRVRVVSIDSTPDSRRPISRL